MSSMFDPPLPAAAHGGVWVTYHHDNGIHINQIHPDELQAHRQANGSGYLTVAFIPYGFDITDESVRTGFWT